VTGTHTAIFSIKLKGTAGEKVTIGIRDGGAVGGGATLECTLTTDYVRYSIVQPSFAYVNDVSPYIRNTGGSPAATVVFAKEAQLEIIDSQQNETPGEYVSVASLIRNVRDPLYLSMPGGSGNYAHTPDSVANSITGDIDIRVQVTFPAYNPASAKTLLGKYGSPNSAYLLILESGGALRFFGSSTGSSNTDGGPSATQTLTAAGLIDGGTYWLRVTKNTTNGDIKYYWSHDNATYTQIGTTVSGAIYNFYESNRIVEIGSYGSGTAAVTDGRVHRAQIYSGIDGTLKVDFWPNRDATTSTGTVISSTTGETWTLAGTTTIRNAAYHGAGIDGVKYFSTINNNVVSAAGVVTEAIGPDIESSNAYGWSPGVVGSYFSTPDSTQTSITGDIDLTFFGALASWTAISQTFISKYGNAGNISYTWDTGTGSGMRFIISLDGTALSIATCSAAIPFVAGTSGYIRVTRSATTGDVKFYTSSTYGSSWTQLGTTQSTTAGSIFNSTITTEIGSRNSGLSTMMVGRIYRARGYNGIGGTLTFDFNPNTWTTGSTWVSSTTSETWTINGSGSIQPVKQGVLIEPAATNSILQSNAFTTTWASVGTPVITQNAVGPDGVSNSAWTLTDDDAGAYEGITQAVTVPNDNGAWTFSIFFKKTGNGSTSRVGFNLGLSGGTTVSATPRLNTDTGVVSSGVVESYGDWWRLSGTITNNTSGNTTLTVTIYSALGAADTVTATGSAVIYGAQLEVGLQPTTYIPTTTTPVARLVDTLRCSSKDWINILEGTLYAEVYGIQAVSGNGYVASLSFDANNQLSIYQSTGAPGGLSLVGGVSQAMLSGLATASLGKLFKIALMYKANDFAAVCNNGTVSTDTSGTLPSTHAYLYVGADGGGGQNARGPIKKISYYGVRLSNSEGKALTV
jgi:hypothetical protein